MASPRIIAATSNSGLNLDGMPADHKLSHDAKRARQHRKKYALGVHEVEPDGHGRPVRPKRARASRAIRSEVSKEHARTAANAKAMGKHPSLPKAVVDDDPLLDLAGTSNANTSFSSENSGSSSPSSHQHQPEGESETAAPVQEEEEDFAYSFDAVRGPRRDSEILGLALARAVERFETGETEKLINREYEVVSGYDDGGVNHDDDDADDDFEIV